MKRSRLFLLSLLLLCPSLVRADEQPIITDDTSQGDLSYYNPYTNTPPGPPPNYNMVDSSYFQGVPNLPAPYPFVHDAGGYYIFNDTAAGKWYITNYLYSPGYSLEQFHGSILAILEQDPAPNVNIWSKGFELNSSLKQNDRWGWVKWPDSIAPNLYEIWWDITIDYAKKNNIGDYRDTFGVCIAGCAVDFNLWSSGHGAPFGPDQIYLGDNKLKLSNVPGFVDTYAGISDQYQVNDPETDPNTSRFSAVALPGASYNKYGLITTGGTYGDRYAGSWAYEANGVQFSTLFCPPNLPPNFVTPPVVEDPYVFCTGQTLYDTLNATDPDPNDTLEIVLLSGLGTLTHTPSLSPAYGYYQFDPDTSGTYVAVFAVYDSYGFADTIEVSYEVVINTPPQVELPDDTIYFLCDPSEICLPLLIIDNDCDVTSVDVNYGDYTGTLANFDQVNRINQLGGTITQIGGGAPGQVLTTAVDFVGPINQLSGVSVTLPNFVFADHVVNYGSFPNGIEPGNSADHLLYEPTDMTFTTPGSGGPDGGSGDGSVAFNTGNNCVVGFGQDITTCNGANVDFIIFTNTNGGGTAELKFRLDGVTVHTITRVIPGGSAQSGVGGVTFDLPEGITFNEVRIASQSGLMEIDAFAARVAASSTTADICFQADTSGVYEIIVSVTDSCGNTGADTTEITIQLNSAPVANAGSDINTFLCTLSQICFGVSFSDPDNNLSLTEKTSGPGTLAGNQICFTPTLPGAYTFVIHALDSCGEHDYDTVVVTVSSNSPPVANQPPTVNQSMCLPTQLCHTFTATDPNGGTLTWSFLAGVGTITPQGEFCFTPTASGTYNAAVVVSDSCGALDTATISYNIQLNAAPVANNPSSPVSLFQCSPQQQCYQFTATDANGGTLNWTKISGAGTVTTGGLFCFTPVGSGSYSVTVAVADTCGAADTTSLTYNVTLNQPPIIALGNDTAISLCQPQQLCFPYSVSDPQGLGGLTEMMVSGFGTIDTAGNQVCFTPTTAGSYQIIVSVTDSCGASDADTINANVTFGIFATINCPAGPINVNLCAPDVICQMLAITPGSATVSTSFGTYSSGQLCFNADTSGTYNITVIASESCGADTCQLTFNVNIGAAAQINCPAASNYFLCAPDTLCVPVGINGSGVTVNVSPIGSYQSGTLCFPADTSGHYEIRLIASSSCGADTCFVEADVAINSAPVAANPASPVDTFICAGAQICYQFSATDADGGTLNWARLSGNGTVTGAGLWCFNANSSGAYSVTAQVTDSCGAADTVNLTYNVTVNSSPSIAFGNDTTVFLCASQTVCIDYTASDGNNNIQTVEVLSGPGVIDTLNSSVCFLPAAGGNYQFIVKVTDSCGATDVDTVNATVNFNQAPIVNAGVDQNIFQCTPAQICWPVSASDPDGNLTTVQLINGPGTYNGSTICFTPTQSWCYEFVLKATDACGAMSFDTVAVCVELNVAPVASAGADQNIFRCTPTQICWPVSSSDANGNLITTALISGPGTYNGSTICFTPGATGSYTFVLEATDACGATDRDTAVISVTINTSPVCQVPNDTLIFQCTPTQVCLPAFAADAENNLSFCQVSVGTLVGNTWCYTPTSDQVVTVTMTCEDACGAVCQSQFTVEFELNNPPTIAFGNDTSIFLCTSEPVCLPFTYSDPDYPRPVTITLVSGPGTLDIPNARVCYTPAVSGTSTFVIRIEDECGSADVDTINVTVDLNEAPFVDAGVDQTLFLCDGTSTICWTAFCSDADGNLLDCIFTGPGLYDGSQICFNPTTSSSYVFTLTAEDDCGLTASETITVNVTINSAPSIAFGNDTAISLCSPQSLCFPYAVNDPNGLGGLVESMLPGVGTIDTSANQVCFTPTTGGTYEFIIKVKDSCNAMNFDTLNVTVDFGATPSITNCPAGPVDVSLCSPDQVCYMLNITPPGATVTTSFGTYSGGQLCFDADTSGTYMITVIAEESCGADTCELTFSVDIGSAANLTCPGPQNLFICSPDSVCISITAMGPGVSVSVTPIGAYNAGSVCFPADSSGHYELIVIASTPCGSDTCTITADVTIDSAPIAVDPPSPVDTFICDPGVICYQFAASDVNGGALTWMKLSGDGSVSPSGNWCFDALVTGPYQVTVKVTDSCGKADTTALTYNVTINQAPIVSLGTDQYAALCAASQLCYPYTVTDADNNVVSELLTNGVGSLDTVGNQLCFTPDTAGVYRFVVSVTDACGEFDIDTLRVTVSLNIAPIVNAGTDQTVFQCNPGQYCWPASVADGNNNLDTAYVVGGLGTFNGSSICFLPDTAGHYRFVLYAEDECGAFDLDTVFVDVSFNDAPSCQVPNDTSIFQCTPMQVSLPVSGSDPDGNFDHCELAGGPGSLVGGFWVYTPTNSGTVKVKIMCLDLCGASCVDSFFVTFNLNQAPVVNAGPDTTVFQCTAAQICLPITVTDVDDNVTNVTLMSPIGTFNSSTMLMCFTPTDELTYTFIIRATDSCGAQDFDTVRVTVELNEPPDLDMPPNFVAYLDEPGEVCFNVGSSDPDGNLNYVFTSLFATYNSATDEVCFTADTSGVYCVTVGAVDSCNVQLLSTVCVTIVIDECVHVSIEKTHGSIQGQMQTVDIFLNGSGKDLGGFDLLISYDQSALLVTGVEPGDLFVNCGWEYFNYRLGADGNCPGCPSGLIRVVGIAETNNGAYHPDCFFNGLFGNFVKITFLISNDRTLECQYVPIQFFWMDCGDNSLSSRLGDTLWVSRDVYSFEGSMITNETYGFPGYFGAHDDCLIGAPGKPTAIRCIDFTNGGVDIVCADSIDARGDINLNEVEYEIADAVLFSNYFIYGLSVFTVNVQGQIAATDVNADGLTLSVADLVYLIRVVVGDSPALPKLNPNQLPEASLAITGDELHITASDAAIGAVTMIISGDAKPELLPEAGNMDLRYNFDGENTRVLIYNLNGKSYLETGALLKFNGNNKVKTIEIGSYDGYVMNAKLNSLPDQFALDQNYPNPFNPLTTINFALPVACEWELEIYNILGQTVENWKERSEAGYIKIEWDASKYASGVYFYRLRAGDFSDTKKMVLLK